MIPITLPVYQIDLPKPKIGNKIFCIDRPGFFVFEKGPCTWQAMANTHQGTGCIKVWDGVPDESGFFGHHANSQELYRNGRMVFNANPPILGMWMFAGGLDFGFTIEVSGVLNNIGPCLTVTWMPDAPVKRNIQAV